MSTLSSSSTLAEVKAAYKDNASWSEDQSVTKARAFVTAARILLVELYSQQTKGSNSLGFRVDLVESQLEKAERFAELHATDGLDGPKSAQASFRNFRGPYGRGGRSEW